MNWTYRGVAFVCDEAKQRINKRKHQVDLIEASPVFFDPYNFSYYDQEHSEHEDRHCVTGMATNGRLLFVTYTFRNGSIRLISARKAKKIEVQIYEKQCNK